MHLHPNSKFVARPDPACVQQGYRVCHPPRRGSGWKHTRPCVHAGFLAGWRGNGFDQTLLDLIWKEILQERMPQRQPRILITGVAGSRYEDEICLHSLRTPKQQRPCLHACWYRARQLPVVLSSELTRYPRLVVVTALLMFNRWCDVEATGESSHKHSGISCMPAICCTITLPTLLKRWNGKKEATYFCEKMSCWKGRAGREFGQSVHN